MVPRFQPVVLGLLYHVSMEDRYKSLFTFTDCLQKMFEMLMRVQDLRNTPELIALAVNLTQNPRNAEVGRGGGSGSGALCCAVLGAHTDACSQQRTVQ